MRAPRLHRVAGCPIDDLDPAGYCYKFIKATNIRALSIFRISVHIFNWNIFWRIDIKYNQ